MQGFIEAEAVLRHLREKERQEKVKEILVIRQNSVRNFGLISYNNSFSFYFSILVYFASVKQIVSGGVFPPSVCAGVGGRCNPVQCFGAASKVCTIVCG